MSICKIYTKYQAAVRPVRLGAGPGCRLLAAAWYFEYIQYILQVFVYQNIKTFEFKNF